MPFFTHRGHSLYFESVGAGDRHMVLMHGILMDAGVNRGLAEALASWGYHVHLIELLGHGRSDKPKDISLLRMDEYADQAVDLLNHLGVEKAVFGGVSLGAIVSLQVGVRHPSRVEALMLEMPVLENAVPGVVLLLAPVLLATRFLPIVMRRLAGFARKLPEGQHIAYRSLKQVMSNPPSATARILSGALVGPIAPTLEERKALTMPTLIIGHPYDALHPFTDAEQLSKQIPRGTFVEAASILEMRTKPERLLGIVRQFLDALPRAPSTTPAQSKLN